MRIVLDTNCLVRSIPANSPFHEVWEGILSGKHILCVTNEIIEEYAEVLSRLANQRVAQFVVDTILESRFVQFVNPTFRFNLITADPDDNKFVDCAICANAKYIVSNDHHYDILKAISFPKVDVVALEEFVRLIHK